MAKPIELIFSHNIFNDITKDKKYKIIKIDENSYWIRDDKNILGCINYPFKGIKLIYKSENLSEIDYLDSFQRNFKEE